MRFYLEATRLMLTSGQSISYDDVHLYFYIMSSSNIGKSVLLSANNQPGRSQNSSEISSSSCTDLIENRLKFEHSIDQSVVLLHNKNHQKRLEKLREELNYLQETAWRYQSIEKILGQN